MMVAGKLSPKKKTEPFKLAEITMARKFCDFLVTKRIPFDYRVAGDGTLCPYTFHLPVKYEEHAKLWLAGQGYMSTDEKMPQAQP
jgi:hypothetical protein